jgi:hypothetical protein
LTFPSQLQATEAASDDPESKKICLLTTGEPEEIKIVLEAKKILKDQLIVVPAGDMTDDEIKHLAKSDKYSKVIIIMSSSLIQRDILHDLNPTPDYTIHAHKPLYEQEHFRLDEDYKHARQEVSSPIYTPKHQRPRGRGRNQRW